MKTMLLVLGMCIGLSSVSYAQADVKIGYVDLQRVIRDSKAGKSAKSMFETDFKKKKSIIDQKQNQLNSLKEEFFQKAPVMEEMKRKNMGDDIEKREKELKRMRADFREDLQKRDFELTQKILADLEGVIQSFGEKKSFTMIIEKTEGGVVYAADSVDVTGDIIKAYDASK